MHAGVVEYFVGRALSALLSPASVFSIYSIAGALLIAAGFLIARRGAHGLPVKVLRRALFPRRMMRSASSRTDMAFTFYSVFLSGLLVSWAVLSGGAIGEGVGRGLITLLGALPAPAVPPLALQALATVALFLTLEATYYGFHYATHRVPALWAFHKVHHAAEILTPLTVARVHPIESLLYYNALAVTLGLVQGLLDYGFGEAMAPFSSQPANVLKIAFLLTFAHLQHSELWIPATGWLGRLVLSPAHHQIHHSSDPAHFDRNFGFCLAIFDRLFGTLEVPTRANPRIRFGVPSEGYSPHGLKGALWMPFVGAWRSARPAEQPAQDVRT